MPQQSESTTEQVGTRVAVRLYDGTRRNAPINHPVAAKVRCISSPNNLTGTELPFRSTDSPVCPNRESGSPYPGGKFCRRPRRGLLRSRREQKGMDTHGFPSSLNSYLSFRGHGGNGREETAPKRRTAVGLPWRRGAQCAPISLPIRSVRYPTATHIGYSTQARHKVNGPKGKRRYSGVYPCHATRSSVLIPSFCE